MYEEFDDKQGVKTKLNYKTWVRLFSYIKEYKKNIIFALISITIVTLVETFIIKFISQEGLKTFLEIGVKNSKFVWFIIGMIVLIILGGIGTKYYLYNISSIERKISGKLTSKVFSHLQSLSYSFYDKYSVGWLISRTTSDTQRVSETISWSFSDIIYAIFKLFFILGIMLSINPLLALIMLITVPLVVLISSIFRGAIVKYSWKVRKINSKVSGALNEGISGAKTTKSLVLESKNLNEFNEIVNNYKHYSIKSRIFNSMFFQTVSILLAFSLSVMAYYGGNLVLDGTIAVEELFLFISYTTMFFDPILSITFTMSDMKQAQVAADRVFNILDIEPEVKDSEEVVAKYGDYYHKKIENYEKLDGNIRFDHVSFKYSSTNKTVLKDFNLDVKKGTSVALVGETGAGKSTIVNLLSRFYEPTEGTIYIDEKDYKERSIYWLHSNLGYVMQTPHLFSGSIADNVRYGNPNASMEEVINACKIANADEFITKLENGYDTNVGEGGNRLSQGQKQLISFARAIIKDPAILILDEATSSIDTETESVIQNAIVNILKNRTSFIVAHRLSTIINCDLILVVRNGEVIEKGSHEELLQLGGYYYKLYTNQFIEEQTNSALD